MSSIAFPGTAHLRAGLNPKQKMQRWMEFQSSCSILMAEISSFFFFKKKLESEMINCTAITGLPVTP